MIIRDHRYCLRCGAWVKVGEPHKWRWSEVTCTEQPVLYQGELKARGAWPNKLDKAQS
jgi:hypothetical protein